MDESVWQTLKRDVLTIGRNLRSVLIPVNWDFHNHTAALHNWDLWGPLVSEGDRDRGLSRIGVLAVHTETWAVDALLKLPQPCSSTAQVGCLGTTGECR